MLPDLRVRQRDYLLEISRAITQELDLDKVLARIVSISIEMLAGQAGLIATRSEDGGWRVGASIGIPIQFRKYIDKLLSNVRTHDDPSGKELPEINHILQSLTKTTGLGLISGVGLPLRTKDNVLGVIFIFRNYQGSFSANDRSLLQSFADQAGIAVFNARLYTQMINEKRRLDTLLDSVADGILILANDHTIERTNKAFLSLIELPLERVKDRKQEEILNWMTSPTGTTLEEAERGGWPLTPTATLYVEGDLKRASGEPIPVGITYAPLITGEGTLTNIIASVRDISRFREAEELKSTFISVISHELKTPVALIKGYVGTLRRPDVAWDTEVVADSLSIIEEEADRLAKLIDNLLDASRLQAGGLGINRADIDLTELTQALARRLQDQSKNHQIMVDFSPDFPIILADEDRMSQVISNLISNAIKYSPSGGKVTLTGRVMADNVIICVSDEGSGIAADDIPHVFDRFYRAPDASRRTKGAGLGLYLAKAVVESHGGRIWIDSQRENGAKICFSLPRDFD